MGTTQALRLPKEYKITLPSATAPVTMRKLTARDQNIADGRFEKEGRNGLELVRLVTLVPLSITQENPAGLPAFSDDGIQDLEIEDITYLTAGMTKLNSMGSFAKKRTFDF